MKKFSFFSWYSISALIIIYLFIFSFIAPDVNFPQNIPDKHFFYTSNQLFDILSNYSANDIQNYINASLKFDIIYPLTNFFFFFILITLLYKTFSGKNIIPKFAYLAALGTIMDYSENISIITLLKNIQNFNYQLASISGIFTMLKWLSYYTMGAIIIILLILIIIKNIKK